jgi:hypothetical protein
MRAIKQEKERDSAALKVSRLAAQYIIALAGLEINCHLTGI